MAQVDQVTQRNASAAEELAATSEQVNAQAEALQQLTAFFQVEGAVPPPPVAPVAKPKLHRKPEKTNDGFRPFREV